MSWSYYHRRPRAEVHFEKYGNYNVPPRQYRMGGGRRAAPAGLNTDILLLLGLGLLAIFLMKKK